MAEKLDTQGKRLRLPWKYDKDHINSGRQPELDFFKARMIMELAVVHVFVQATPDEVLDRIGIPYFFDSIMGGPFGPPGFLFAMGIGLAYSGRDDAKHLAARGLRILWIGFCLNIFRALLPYLTGFLITKDAAYYLEPLPYLIFGNDILQFAGLGMFFMALLQFLKVPKAGLLLIGALMNIIGTMIKGCDTGNIALNILLGHVIGIREDTGVLSEFPLLHWFIVYAAGYVFGDYDRHLVDKKAFYRYVSPVCGLFSITVVAIEMITGSGMMGGEGANVFYHVNPLDVVVCISISFGLLGLFCALKDLWPAWLMRIVESISRNVNTVYLIQWVLVVWIIQVGLRTITGSAYSDHYFAEILLGICLGIVSVLLAEAWTRWKKKRKKKA